MALTGHDCSFRHDPMDIAISERESRMREKLHRERTSYGERKREERDTSRALRASQRPI